MPLPPELELWKVKLNAFHRLSWKFVEGLLVRSSLLTEQFFSCFFFFNNYSDTR